MSDKNSNLNHHLHVWCGVDASLNEISIAERKSIELGRLLDSGCIPVREDQGVESKLFLSSFKSLGGIKFVSRTKIPNVSERKAKQLSSLSGKNVVGIRLGSGIYFFIKCSTKSHFLFCFFFARHKTVNRR